MADYNDGISRSISSAPPSHYFVKIKSYSLLTKNNIKTITSGEFEAGGYKWKLILHPNGNKEKNIDDHISLYLMMVVNGGSLRPGLEVHTTFCFFLYDQNNDDFLLHAVRRFHELKHEWGIDQLISLESFKDPSNGYLVKDTCAIGVEVYVCPKQVLGKGEYMSMIEYPVSYKHTWKINNFSQLNATLRESTTFDAGDQKWKIHLFPKGNGDGAGTHISLFLAFANKTSLPPSFQVHTEYTFRILDQDCAKHKSRTVKHWLSASNTPCGRSRFMTITDINSPNRSYLKKDTCIVEAEIIFHGVAKAL